MKTKCDVLLLAGAFAKLRGSSFKNYELCPSHYLNTPPLSWDAMLSMTKVELELISDANMHFFFGKGAEGGAFYISNRYSQANNKYLKSYDPKQESKLIIYLDAKNLFGYAISKFLLTGRFEWRDFKEFESNKYSSYSLKGCALGVDCEYPKELQEVRNDYPLVLGKIEINKKMLYNYQLKIAYFHNFLVDHIKILVPNFFDKERYVLHYENLKFYCRIVYFKTLF